MQTSKFIIDIYIWIPKLLFSFPILKSASFKFYFVLLFLLVKHAHRNIDSGKAALFTPEAWRHIFGLFNYILTNQTVKDRRRNEKHWHISTV